MGSISLCLGHTVCCLRHRWCTLLKEVGLHVEVEEERENGGAVDTSQVVEVLGEVGVVTASVGGHVDQHTQELDDLEFGEMSFPPQIFLHSGPQCS